MTDNNNKDNKDSTSSSGLKELHKNPNVGNEQYFTSFQKYVPHEQHNTDSKTSPSTQVKNNEQQQSQQHEKVKKDCTNTGSSSNNEYGLKELHKNPNVGNEQYFTSFQKYVPKVQGGEEANLKEIHKNPTDSHDQFTGVPRTASSTNDDSYHQ